LVPPNSEKIYELMFLPLKVGRFFGSISFGSITLGEFWYELDLESKDALPR
jgi:hypothetical protein